MNLIQYFRSCVSISDTSKLAKILILLQQRIVKVQSDYRNQGTEEEYVRFKWNTFCFIQNTFIKR